MTTGQGSGASGAASVDAVIDAFHAVGHALAGSEADSWMHSDLTMAQVRTLFTIFRFGPLPVSSVARHLAVGLPTASHLVDCLVRAGLVERNTDPEDRRVVHCSTTAKGAALVDETAGARTERMRTLLGRLDATTLSGLAEGLSALARLTGEASKEDTRHAGA